MPPFSSWGLFFRGCCMGIADLIPGVSGGTIAFITGIYDALLEAIQSLNTTALRYLWARRWDALSTHVPWRFLLPLLLGIATAFLSLAKPLHTALNNPSLFPLVYAGFFGLVLSSILLCFRLVPHWRWKEKCLLFCSACFAFWLSTRTAHSTHTALSSSFIQPWPFFCGSLAACAMLLPGISGSYMLVILGLYSPVLGAVHNVLDAFTRGVVCTNLFLLLGNVAVGTLSGLLLGARLIRRLLHYFPSLTLAVLIGFMSGALRSLWPFWSYSISREKNLQLLEPRLPVYSESQLWLALAAACFGACSVWILHRLSRPR